jgi:4-phosphopantoate--beta-alanine ligase
MAADITIVDNVVRAVPLIIKEVGGLKKKDSGELERLVSTFDNDKSLKDIIAYIGELLG